MSNETPLRQTLVLANRMLANEGILRGFGHVSVRVPGEDELLIARSLSPHLVTEEDIVRMDFDGTVVEDRDVKTYKETVIHRAIYRNRDNVGAVIHHHAPEIMPFAVTGRELKPVFHLGALFHRGVPTFDEYDPDYGHLVVTEDEGERMADQLGDCRAQFLAGHGANVVGAELQEAVVSTMYLVMNARYQYQAHQIGEPDFYTGPPESIQSMVDDVILEPIVMDRMWEFLERRLSG